tara:strand:- start:6483 stop:8036 length:1554 start_codon:yes stop_codon:yes gene_type:complete
MVISYPFSGSLTPLVFISWVPLLFLESYIAKKSYKSGKVFIHAYISFIIYNVGTTWWVWNAEASGAMLAFILNSLLMTITFYAFHLAKKHIGEKEGYLALVFYWIAFEYFHLNWEMSWTWLTLGNSFSIVPSWVQWYSFGGALGGSFWILLINLLFFRTVQNVYLKKESWKIQTPIFYSIAFLIIFPIGISLYTYYNYTEKEYPIEVIALQPNIDPYNEKFNPASFSKQLETLISLADSLVTDQTDLIVAPETAFSMNFNEAEIQALDFFRYFISQKAEKLNDVPWYIGASTYRLFSKKNSRASRIQGDGTYVEFYNTSMLIDKNNDVEFIHKSKLVPGPEVVPFSEVFPFLEELSIQNGGTSGTLGIEKEPRIFELDEFKFAPVICYESIYGEWVTEQVRKGAQLICIVTNDGWWKDTPGYKQHLSFASLRAIESRRSIVRSANTGTSCFVNQRGDISQKTEWWKRDAIKGKVNLNSEITFYTQYGNVMGRSFSFAAILLLLFTFSKKIRKKYISK